MSRPAVFLDRDGTVNRDVDYLSNPEELELLPGVGPALARLQDAGYLLVVVTNQSGVARGILDEDTLADIHRALTETLATHGVTLDHIGSCPHHPEIGAAPYRRACECRKPRPGLLRDAAQRLSIDLARSWIVGDSERDLAAGAALDVPGILVATGKGAAEHARLCAEGREPERGVADLAAAADLILATDRRRSSG